MATDFSRLTVVDLRQELKRRNLPQTGKKADLIDRLTAHDSENHDEARGSPPLQSPAEAKHDDNQNLPEQQQESPIVDKPSQPLADIAAEEPDSAPAQNLAGEGSTTEEPVATEIIKDGVSRKRRSRSPPPENDLSRKRARPSEQGDEVEHDSEPRETAPHTADNGDSKDAPSELPMQPSQTEDNAATRDLPTNNQEEHDVPMQEHEPPHAPEIAPQHYHGQQTDTVDEHMPDYDRDVAPSQHPATAALYIKNFMRPLREPVLRDYLIELAALPGAAPDPDCLFDFYLDQIRTHAFIQFTSTSAASRVRTALHGTVWPNERNRKELWVDYIPEDKVAEWIGQEQSEAGRGSSARWEVHYEPDDNGDITARLVNAEMEPPRRNSTRQPPPAGPPAAPTGPARGSYPGVEGAPLGPRGRGTNHYRQAPPLPSPGAGPGPSGNGTGPSRYDTNNTTNQRVTRADPPLQYKPVSEEVAERRLANLAAHLTRDRRRDPGPPDDINRYTFEDGEVFVDRGKEAFIGIRPPHRERERRRLGIARGTRGGAAMLAAAAAAAGGGRRRSVSPRRGEGYRGGDRFRDEYRDRGEPRGGGGGGGGGGARYRDDNPRSRFNGQPLPTFMGGGGRGGRRGGGGGGGGWRDRY